MPTVCRPVEYIVWLASSFVLRMPGTLSLRFQPRSQNIHPSTHTYTHARRSVGRSAAQSICIPGSEIGGARRARRAGKKQRAKGGTTTFYDDACGVGDAREEEREGRDKGGNFRAAAERRALSLRGRARKDSADTIFTACPRKE